MKRTLLALSAALASPAFAQEFVNADFESFSSGMAVPTGEGTDRPFEVEAIVTATVIDGSTYAGSSLNSSHVLQIDELAFSNAGWVTFDSGVSYTTGIVTTEFDILFETYDAAYFSLRTGRDSDTAPNVGSFDIDFDPDGRISSSGFDSGLDYEIDTAYSIRVVADIDAGTADAWIDDMLLLSDIDIGYQAVGRALFGFHSTGSDGPYDGLMQIDNVRMTYEVPAPSAGVLLAMCCSLSSRRRR